MPRRSRCRTPQRPRTSRAALPRRAACFNANTVPTHRRGTSGSSRSRGTTPAAECGCWRSTPTMPSVIPEIRRRRCALVSSAGSSKAFRTCATSPRMSPVPTTRRRPQMCSCSTPAVCSATAALRTPTTTTRHRTPPSCAPPSTPCLTGALPIRSRPSRLAARSSGRRDARPPSKGNTSTREQTDKHARADGLQRRDLVVDLCAVVQVVLGLAGGRELELDAVAAHAVVAGEQGRVSDGSDFAFRIVAGSHADPDLHDVPGETPHHRVVRLVYEVVFDRHGDRTSWLVSDVVFLAEDPGDGVRL